MKRKILFILLVSALYGNSPLFPQGFQPPPKGKAVVYFVRTSYYYGIPVPYIHNSHYIGELKGKGYMRYECDTGQQLFWIYASDKSLFILADLRAGGTYLVNYGKVNHGMEGLFGPTPPEVAFYPVTPYSQDVYEESRKLICKKAPVTVPRDTLVLMNKTMKKEISETFEKFNNRWKHEGKYRTVTRDMAIPTELLK